MDQAAHPEDAHVSINLRYYLTLQERLRKRGETLQAWKTGLDHIEIFLSFLHDQEEDLVEKHMDTFNEQFDGAQICVSDSGRVNVNITTTDAEDEELHHHD